MALLLSALTRRAFYACGMNLDQSYKWCANVARTNAKNFYYSFLLLSRPQAPRHVRDLRVHAVLRRFER